MLGVIKCNVFFTLKKVYRGYTRLWPYGHNIHMAIFGFRGVTPIFSVLQYNKKSITGR